MSSRTPTQTRPSPPRRPYAMYAGLALTAAATLVPLIDLVTVDSLTDHVRAAYPYWPADLVAGDRNAIVIYLSAIGLLGIAGWLWAIWAVAKHKRTARLVTTVMFVLGASIALIDLNFSEAAYDRVIPPLYGTLGLLPSLAGLVAVILVWRHGSSSGTGAPGK